MDEAPTVSVVIPVYNPGDRMAGLLDSLRHQSLPPGALEVVAVDDGSTDGSGDRLRALAEEWPVLRVETIPNSGWPGRPRNVGTDLAAGRYVFYSDQDDELFPEALERMAATADRTGADIVYGKVVRAGLHTPYWALWHRDVDRADLVADHLLASRTVHKLYRKAFLVEQHLRFVEGRVRLEDHQLMAEALPRAGVVSVLASYPCYRWIQRTDGTNNSSAAVDPAEYWGRYADVHRTLVEGLPAGPQRDAATTNAVVQAFTRFAPSSWLQRSEQSRTGVFAAVHAYLAELVPPEVDDQLPAPKRLRTQALRDGDRSRFDRLQEWQAEMGDRVELTGAAVADGALELTVRAVALDGEGEPLTVTVTDAGDLLAPVPGLLAGVLPEASRRVDPADLGSLELTVRHAGTGVEWPVPGELAAVPPTPPMTGATTGPAEHPLVITGTVRLDPATVAFGGGLAAGTWHVLARGSFLGEGFIRRLPVPEPRTLDVHGRRARVAALRLARTERGTLLVTVDPTAREIRAARWDDGELALEVTSTAAEQEQVPAVLARERGSDRVLATSEAGGSVRLRLPEAEPGTILDLWVDGDEPSRLAWGVPDPVEGCGWRAYGTQGGSWASVKRMTTGGTAPPTTGGRRATPGRGLLPRVRDRLSGLSGGRARRGS